MTVLLPQKVAKCTKQQVDKLSATFPNDFEDPDALLADIEMMANDIEKSGAKNLRMLQSASSGSNVFTQALRKLIN